MIVAQIVGFIALLFTFTGFQINNRKKLLRIFIVSASLYTMHFILLGAFTGASMNAINIIRNTLFSKKYDKGYEWIRSRWVLALFISLFIIAGTLTWDGWYSTLPVIGMVSGTIAFWMKNTTAIRLIALIAPPCWFSYNFIVSSYAGMVVEVLTLISIIIAITRYDILKHKHIAKK